MTVGGNVSREAKISGRVTADGRLTATLEGKSVYKGDTPNLAQKLAATLVTFPFGGTLAGTIIEGQGSGTFQAQSTDQRKPVLISGTWTASANVHRPL
jgi:hypothetical protein